MGEFTISQTRTGNNLYIYPDGDLTGCTDWSTFGDAPNYACVDEDKDNPDDDITYVYNVTDSKVDLYTLPNQTATGTINYVQVYSRAKSHEYAQAQTGVYYILVAPAGICTDYYESDDKDLVTTYKTYNNVWTTNPKTSVAWVWADIDLLCIGQRATSPSIYLSKTLTIRPNAAGTTTELSTFNCTNNYECVDEEVLDTSDYVSNPIDQDDWDTDLYNMDDHTTEHGAITKVALFYVAQSAGSEDPQTCKVRSRIRTGGNEYNGTEHLCTFPYQIYSDEWVNNPDTGVAWTWANIDAVECGIDLYYGTGFVPRCQQEYLVVYYDEDTSPQIRCTQSYCRVKYDTSATCTVDKPETISTNHARNIKMLNFWSGDREVYDLNRSGKSMVMRGIFYKDACTDLSCIRDMALNGSTITISNLGQTCYEGDYRIRSVGWDEISKTPEVFRWIIDLEAAD